MNILFAWEMGANFGHLSRCVPVAERLHASGHRVLFAVRDVRIAGQWLGQRFPFLQAPLVVSNVAPDVAPASHAEMLLAAGWDDRTGLGGQILAWRQLLRLTAPDRIVADHAPGMLLAARTLGVPAIALGNGFEIPDGNAQHRSIRPWEAVSEARLESAENRALARANDVLRAFDREPIERLSDLYASRPLLATFPELDHCGERSGARYLGSIHGQTPDRAKQLPEWPAGDGARVFAYLRARHAATPSIIAALKETGVRALCVVPDAPPSFDAEMGGGIRLLRAPIDLGAVLRNADVAVGYGGAGFIAQSLLAGVPMLLAPQYAEQYLGALRVESLGAGVVLQGGARSNTATALRRMLETSEFRSAARRFASKYADWTSDRAVDLAALAIVEPLP